MDDARHAILKAPLWRVRGLGGMLIQKALPSAAALNPSNKIYPHGGQAAGRAAGWRSWGETGNIPACHLKGAPPWF